jgi:anti-anti-sigma regulatory factor
MLLHNHDYVCYTPPQIGIAWEGVVQQPEDRSMMRRSQAQRRLGAYLGLCIVLILGYLVILRVPWQGNSQLHTLMEAVTTFVALTVGVLALVRFYSQKNNTFLFIGSGYLGAALLDGYHTVVTSAFVSGLLPSNLSSLAPWSWMSSRLFLSILLCLSWLAWRREVRLGAAGQIGERMVFLVVGALTLTSFLFFSFVPLPRAYHPELFFPRIEEFVPAVLFGLTLAGYLHKGNWRSDLFEHWLIFSLITAVISQALVMSLSAKLFDLPYDAAHLLKTVSYIFVLVGLVSSMYGLFLQSVESVAALARSNQALQTEIVERRLTEAALHERGELVRVQAATLSELSIILLPISDHALVMPLIGALDSERAQRFTAALLAGVTTSRARVVIVDITGMPMLDAQAANALIDAARGVRLLGAEAIITGIRAEVARNLVELGVDLSGIVTHNSLQSGIAYALAETNGVSLLKGRPPV